MKITEMMYGDLAVYKDKVIVVDAVHKRKIGFHERPDIMKWVHYSELKSIPITENLLQRIGFVDVSSTMPGTQKVFVIQKNKQHWFMLTPTQQEGIWHIRIQGPKANMDGVATFIHEVQNYMTVTGLITVKEKPKVIQLKFPVLSCNEDSSKPTPEVQEQIIIPLYPKQ